MEEKIVGEKEGIFPLLRHLFHTLIFISHQSLSTLRLRKTYHPTLVHRQYTMSTVYGIRYTV
jgi:hypothetical protein